MILNQC